MNAELLLNAIVSGVLLGGFYAAVSIGLTLSLGLLDVPQVAHPAFIIAGGYVLIMLERLGLPILLMGLLLTPVFFVSGVVMYRLYHWSFERRGMDTETRGIAFFVGVAFVVEIGIALIFGMDTQMVNTVFAGKSLQISVVRMPYRLLVTFGCSWVLAGVIGVFLSRTFSGRAIKAVAQDEMALELVGADPVRIKQLAFGIGTATIGVVGALMLIVTPIQPSMGWTFLGKAFAVAIISGLGSLKGTLAAAIILGLAESIVLATVGTSWTPAIAFALVLVVLIVRPVGLFQK